jgi:hypothetical protein
MGEALYLEGLRVYPLGGLGGTDPAFLGLWDRCFCVPFNKKLTLDEHPI